MIIEIKNPADLKKIDLSSLPSNVRVVVAGKKKAKRSRRFPLSRLREEAARGSSLEEIAFLLGWSVQTVNERARKHNIRIPRKGRTVITAEIVTAVKAMTGQPALEIAIANGVSRTTVDNILRGDYDNL